MKSNGIPSKTQFEITLRLSTLTAMAYMCICGVSLCYSKGSASHFANKIRKVSACFELNMQDIHHVSFEHDTCNVRLYKNNYLELKQCVEKYFDHSFAEINDSAIDGLQQIFFKPERTDNNSSKIQCGRLVLTYRKDNLIQIPNELQICAKTKSTPVQRDKPGQLGQYAVKLICDSSVQIAQNSSNKQRESIEEFREIEMVDGEKEYAVTNYGEYMPPEHEHSEFSAQNLETPSSSFASADESNESADYRQVKVNPFAQRRNQLQDSQEDEDHVDQSQSMHSPFTNTTGGADQMNNPFGSPPINTDNSAYPAHSNNPFANFDPPDNSWQREEAEANSRTLSEALKEHNNLTNENGFTNDSTNSEKTLIPWPTHY
ncbi:MAG: hypothetical protein GF398_01755 [Chitinivibrionales bacterium]|nr:hypothetical protein [Chitinivibrionales bacterium]